MKTEFRKKKEARELAIYNDFQRLMQEEGSMATSVTQSLMKKYGIYASSTMWEIRKRVAKRLENEK